MAGLREKEYPVSMGDSVQKTGWGAVLALCACLALPAFAASEDSYFSELRKSGTPINALSQAAPAPAKVTVTIVWASWCPFCKQALGEAEAAVKANRFRADQVRFQGVAVDEEESASRQHLANANYSFAMYHSKAQKSRRPASIRSIPLIRLDDENGKLIAMYSGFSYERWNSIQKKIRWHLGESEE